MVKKARIKGTEFEIEVLREYDFPGSTTWLHCQGEPNRLYMNLPKEWVEFIDPPRPEGEVGVPQIDADGAIWIKYEEDGLWFCVFDPKPWRGSPFDAVVRTFAPGKHNGFNWAELQRLWPTKRMVSHDD